MTTPELEEELDDTGLGGPIVFLAIGVPSLLVGVPWLIGSFIGMGNCNDASDLGGYYYDDSTCENSFIGPLLLSGLLTSVGVPFTIVGSILLPKRISHRSALSDEIELRKNYGQTSFFELRHGPLPTVGGGFSYGFSGTF